MVDELFVSAPAAIWTDMTHCMILYELLSK